MSKLINKIFKVYTNKKQSKEVQSDFFAWLIDEDKKEGKERELERLWADSSQEIDGSTLLAWSKFKQGVTRGKDRYSLIAWRAIAAIFILISSGLLYMLINNVEASDLIEQYTQVAQVDSVYLPDGTLVFLNSTTTLLYPSEFKGKTRSVYLIGEATFDVQKNEEKPFIVKTSHCNITALGTHFNVEAYSQEKRITATLLSGSIAIANLNSDTKTILQPNEQYVYDKNTSDSFVADVDVSIITSWQKGELTIQDKTLKEITHILERKYPINFQYHWDLMQSKDKYNFKFKVDAPIEEVLNVIKTVSGIDYIITDDVCYLK